MARARLPAHERLIADIQELDAVGRLVDVPTLVARTSSRTARRAVEAAATRGDARVVAAAVSGCTPRVRHALVTWACSDNALPRYRGGAMAFIEAVLLASFHKGDGLLTRASLPPLALLVLRDRLLSHGARGVVAIPRLWLRAVSAHMSPGQLHALLLCACGDVGLEAHALRLLADPRIDAASVSAALTVATTGAPRHSLPVVHALAKDPRADAEALAASCPPWLRAEFFDIRTWRRRRPFLVQLVCAARADAAASPSSNHQRLTVATSEQALVDLFADPRCAEPAWKLSADAIHLMNTSVGAVVRFL